MKLENLIKTECNILQFDTLPSTNDTAKELGLRGEKENTVVIARAQTAGRGRIGRQFFSPDQSGIYMSILLRPTFSPDKSHLLTPAAAVAVAEAIDSVCGTDCKIKWVNDIYLNNKKVCGILTENTFSGDGFFSVIGIGINLFAPEGGFPEDIKDIAASILKGGSEEIRNRLIVEVIDRFNFYYKNLLNKDFLRVYREKSNLIGKEVAYIKNGEEITATVLGIDENAALIVESCGKTDTLFTGEVSVKIK